MDIEQQVSLETEGVREIRSKELAGRLKIAESTLRKYSALLEKQGYSFKREPDNNNGRLYNDKDIGLLLEMKDLIDNQNQKLPMAASIALSRRDDVLPAAQSATPTVPRVSQEELVAKFEQRMQYYFESVMTVEDGRKIREDIEKYVEVAEEKAKKQDEENRLLREQNEMLKKELEKSNKGFFRRLFGG